MLPMRKSVSSAGEGPTVAIDKGIAAARGVLEALRAAQVLPTSVPTNLYFPVTRMKDALEHDDAMLQDGVCVSGDGVVLVACNVRFPAGDPSSIAWWFSAGCVGDDEYRRWHPGDHVEGHFGERWSTKVPADVVGETHFVTEFLGADRGARPQQFRIKFCAPGHYGVSAAALRDARAEAAVAARVATRDPFLGWLDVGHFIHFTTPAPEGESGFSLKSRFWLFDVEATPDSPLWFARSVVRFVANHSAVRSVAARALGGDSPFGLGAALWRHVTEEFGVLATFLHDLHDAARKDPHARPVKVTFDTSLPGS